VAVPIVEIECASQCYPSFAGVFVNPTSRLALRGTCTEKCDGNEKYEWLIDNPPMQTVSEGSFSVRQLWKVEMYPFALCCTGRTIATSNGSEMQVCKWKLSISTFEAV
jgi:hypothetical protein